MEERIRQTNPEYFNAALESAASQWAERAACADANPDIFFPSRGESSAKAMELCRGCEVRLECLDYALRTHQRHGIWGGLTERGRRRVKSTRKLAGDI